MIDGFFHEFAGLNPSFGPFGDVRHGERLCGPVGTPTAHADCNIPFVDNWVRALQGQVRGFEGTNPDNSTVFINGTDPLPAAAAQIAAAAGPRY